jgi:hypothetical protein
VNRLQAEWRHSHGLFKHGKTNSNQDFRDVLFAVMGLSIAESLASVDPERRV